MDENEEWRANIEALLPARKAFEAFQQARLSASRGRGTPVEPTKENLQIAKYLSDHSADIGWPEQTEDGWCIVTAMHLHTGEDVVRLDFPSASTLDEALDKAILVTAGYFWLLALGTNDHLFYRDVDFRSRHKNDPFGGF